jgi:SH3-like domain-containing protein
MRQPQPKVHVRLEHRVEYSDPIQIASGERVSVGHEDDEFPGWKWCKASDGREGWVPVELLSSEGSAALVLEDYSARELAVQPGEEVAIENARHNWLLVRNARGERDWVPASHTGLTPPATAGE